MSIANPDPEPENITRESVKVQPWLSRLVVIEKTYFQSSGLEPVLSTHSYEEHLQTEEQPYSRRVKIGKEWIKLDRGWIQQASLIIVAQPNLQFKVIPTKDEILAAIRPLEIGVLSPRNEEGGRDMYSPPKVETTVSPMTGLSVVYPGQSARIPYPNLDLLHLRCNHEEACWCSITIYPA